MHGDRDLPPEAFGVGLTLLPSCGARRIRALLMAFGGAEVAWVAVTSRPDRVRAALVGSGAAPAQAASLAARWRDTAAGVDVGREWARVVDREAGVWLAGQPDFPAALGSDPEPPAVLYRQGVAGALERPAAAIVGTRRCTGYGRDVARELARDLAFAGVCVVSGLALGIDGAAHEGALAVEGAPPVAVVGSGLDVIYPPRHRGLWRRVAERGLLLSEAPLGAAPEPWRFPQRNRVIAGLASVVVVVESHAQGGSMSTVRCAIDRGVPVLAVPGSVRSPASSGTNHLLAEGAAPVTDAQDVLVAMALEGVIPDPQPSVEREVDVADAPEDPVLDAVDWTPTATEEILRRTGLSLGEASMALTRLEVAGFVRRNGGWWERTSRANHGPSPENGREPR